MVQRHVVLILCALLAACSAVSDDDALKKKASRVPLEWVVSAPVPEDRISLERYPSAFTLFAITWSDLVSENGAWTVSAMEDTPDERVIFMRTALQAEGNVTFGLQMDTPGRVIVFVNHRRVHDETGSAQIEIALDKGVNEILLILEEEHSATVSFDDNALPDGLRLSEMSLQKVWEVTGLNVPESVIHDPARERFYVSNYAQAGDNSGSISLLSSDGALIEKDWVTGLDSPTGTYLHDGALYIVERRYLTVIDVQSGQVARRHPLPEGTFYNDVTIDSDGRIFISDTSTDLAAQDILVLQDDAFSVWAGGEGLHRTNGLHIEGRELIAGSTGTAALVRLALDSPANRQDVRLAGGIIDGIRSLDDETLLVSQWRGRIFTVDRQGEVRLLLDTPGVNIADFEYVPESGLVVVPTFFANSVVAYRLAREVD